MADEQSSRRKRPSPDERLELVVPARLKSELTAVAAEERLPVRVLVRLACEQMLRARQQERSAA